MRVGEVSVRVHLELAAVVTGAALLVAAVSVRLGMALQERAAVVRCLDPHVVVDRRPAETWIECPPWYSTMHCRHERDMPTFAWGAP